VLALVGVLWGSHPRCLDGLGSEGVFQWLLAADAARKEVSRGYSAKRFPGMLLEVRVGAVAGSGVTDSCRAHAH
jgi:hypothetical protein